MQITKLGRLSTPRDSAEIRDQFLRDVRLAAIDVGITDPPVAPGTDWWLLGSGLAEMQIVSLANMTIGIDDQNILDATGEALDKIRRALALPEVTAAPASGKVKITTFGSVTVVNGQQFLYPNGLRGKVVSTYVNPPDGREIDVVAIDTGTQTNLAAGTVVRFLSPPANLATDATVSDGEPLTGGTDAEDDERKRDRILNTLRNKPAGGNWAHLRQIALDELGTVQDCYVYPAPGGPGSTLIVPVKDFDPVNRDWSRALSSAGLNTVRDAIQSQMPTAQEMVVKAVIDQPVHFTLKMTLPASSLSGGNGQGWLDASPWPPLTVGDDDMVNILSAVSNVIHVDALTTVPPIEGQTRIAWWSTTDRKFYIALVTAVSGSSGDWALTLDRPLVDSTGAAPVGGSDTISPAAQNIEKYGAAWVDFFRTLGPGEVTANAFKIPRALRHPFVSDEDPSDVTELFIAKLARDFPEIVDIQFGVEVTTTPTVPATVATAPSILTPGEFGIYKL
jgi:uncharacterized phage protein gp47/JayE